MDTYYPRILIGKMPANLAKSKGYNDNFRYSSRREMILDKMSLKSNLDYIDCFLNDLERRSSENTLVVKYKEKPITLESKKEPKKRVAKKKSQAVTLLEKPNHIDSYYSYIVCDILVREQKNPFCHSKMILESCQRLQITFNDFLILLREFCREPFRDAIAKRISQRDHTMSCIEYVAFLEILRALEAKIKTIFSSFRKDGPAECV